MNCMILELTIENIKIIQKIAIPNYQTLPNVEKCCHLGPKGVVKGLSHNEV